jgi:hypothetical protein
VTTPKEEVKASQYYKNSYTDLARPFLERKLQLLGDVSTRFSREGDFLFGFLSGIGCNTPCEVDLITSGITLSTLEHNRVIGFVNTPHADRCDLKFRERVTCQSRLDAASDKCSQIPRFDFSNLDYIRKVGDTIGYGRPTTCGYQFLTKDLEPVEFICYFLFNTLRVCVRIRNYVGHQFYAYSMVHHTSFSLVLKGGKVHFLSPNGEYNVFAWGKG